MIHSNLVNASEKARGPRSRSFASKLAVFGTAAALVVAPALVSVTAASAADAFAVTTPTNGATAVPLAGFNLVEFTGTGLPAGDYAYVTYSDVNGAANRATYAGSTRNADGTWSGSEDFRGLPAGETRVVATVTARINDGAGPDNQGTVDTTVAPVVLTFDLAEAPNPANPFTVAAPESNSTTPVASTTPTFSGTGNPGATIKITYGARAGATGTAATVKVDADGNWSTTTDFSQIEPGETKGSAIVTEYGTNGEVFPGTDGMRINFVFPSAPAPAIPLTLTASPKSSTISSAISAGVSFVATGFSPGEEVTIAVTDSNGSVVTIAKTVDHYYAETTDGSFSGLVILPTTAGAGTYTVSVTGLRSVPERTASGTFVVTANPATGAGNGSLPVVSG